MSSKFLIYNATDAWQRETSIPSIPTFSQNVDNILGYGGIQLGSVTEFLGLPGSGKTQLCIQLCASVQIPKVLGGLSSEALFIDTNTNFTVERFKEILFSSLDRCQKLLDMPFEINQELALRKLHYVNAFGLVPFCALMEKLPNIVEERPGIKLIVIDSITFPSKEGIEPKQRTGLLFRQVAQLHKLAHIKQIAVVLTNEMSTRVGLSGGNVVGALGDAWAHRCNSRVLLSAQDCRSQRRAAMLLKSNLASNDVACFQITDEGIRDIE